MLDTARLGKLQLLILAEDASGCDVTKSECEHWRVCERVCDCEQVDWWVSRGSYRDNGQQRPIAGTSLVVQWLRLHAANAGGPGSIPSQGTRAHRLQLRVHMLQVKILYAATKTEDPVYCD